MDNKKVCTSCKVEKEYSEFSKQSSTKDGLTYRCKKCSSSWGKSNYEKYTGRKRKNKKNQSQKRKEAYQRLLKDNASWGSGIYLVTTECGETYVGSTKYLKARNYVHKCKNPRPDSCIAGYYKVAEFKILEVIEDYTRTKGKIREQYWMDELQPTLNQRKALQKVRIENINFEGLIEDAASYYGVTSTHIRVQAEREEVAAKGPLAGVKIEIIT